MQAKTRAMMDAGALAILWAFVLVATVLLAGALKRDQRARQEDFAVYYLLARTMRQHRNPYAIDIGEMAWVNGANIHDISRGSEPPTFLLPLEPLARLPLQSAYWAWQAINVVCVVVLSAPRTTSLGVRKHRPPASPVASGTAISAPAQNVQGFATGKLRRFGRTRRALHGPPARQRTVPVAA